MIANLSTKQTDETLRFDLTQEQSAEYRTEISSNLMKIEDLEEQLKDIKADFKVKLDDLKSVNKYMLKNVRNGFVDKEMRVFNVPDDDKQIIEFYDDKNVKVGERRMFPSEKGTIPFTSNIAAK